MTGRNVVWLWAAVLALSATDAMAMYTPNPAARWEPGRFFIAGDFQYTDEKDLDPAGEIDDEWGMFVRPSFAIARNVVVNGRLGFQDADGIDSGVAIGVGLQAAWELPQAPDWAIGGAIDYLWWDIDTDGGADVDYGELQLAPAISYNVPQFRELTPYAGMAIDFLTDDLEEDDTVGLFFGSNFDISERVRLDAQFRIIHEEGLLLSAGYLF